MNTRDNVELIGEQKKVLTLPINGPVLIKGGAGSGKTLVAIKRAMLIKRVRPEWQVAIFTYTNELVAEIKEEINRNEPNSRIEVFGFCGWLYNFLKSKGALPCRYIDEEKLRKARCLATENAFTNKTDRAISNKTDDFYSSEISWLKGRRISSLEEYRNTSRAGRGTTDRVTKDDKTLLWKMFVEYNNFLKQNKIEDWDDRVENALNIVSDASFSPCFDNIVIDEAQDFSLAQILLLRKLVHDDNVTIVADAAQKIYQSGFSWAAVGLNVRGRSFEFTHNYRNTRQIAAAAYSLMSKEQDTTDYTNMSLPSREGEKPLVVLNSSEKDLVSILKVRGDWNNSVVAVPKRADVDKIPITLINNGVNGVHVKTYHSLKGLQFDHVYLFNMKDLNLFFRAGVDQEEISKMRKLIYVAMTRARKTLTMFADTASCLFISEINKELLNFKTGMNANVNIFDSAEADF